MLNKTIKIVFAAAGAFTGFTLTNAFIVNQRFIIRIDLKVVIFVLITLSFSVLFYTTANKIIDTILKFFDRMESFLHNMTMYELVVSSIGLIIGLIVANLITIPINKIDIVGVPLSIMINILFGCTGIVLAIGKKNDLIAEIFKNKGEMFKSGKRLCRPKILDTSVIIDGRIVDIYKSGFMEGELIITSFVLEELRHIADSSDVIKRNRGKRGLDVLNILQKELHCPVRIEHIEKADGAEVDSELLKLAKKLGGSVVTIDYNLNKVADFQGVSVLNINGLANAMKPIALPGEEIVVQVIKDGKENGQGIGYMDDGTMIVVEEGKKHMGESISVMVTSILQTAAGRMIFAKPKYSIERVI